MYTSSQSNQSPLTLTIKTTFPDGDIEYTQQTFQNYILEHKRLEKVHNQKIKFEILNSQEFISNNI